MRHSVSLDWELTIQWWGLYTREEFEALDIESQARMIAVYRVYRKMESVIAQDQSDKIRRGD